MSNNSNEPLFTSGEINVIAPIEIKLTTKDSWGGDNSIEGLLDDSGQFGCCTSQGSSQSITLNFDRVYLFTFLEFKACRLGEGNQIAFLDETKIEYKVNEDDDDWTMLKWIEKKDIKYNPKSSFIHFDTPVKAKYFRFFKSNNLNLFFGMLRMYGYAPYVAHKTTTGVVQPYVSEPTQQDEPKYTSGTVNVIIPTELKMASKDSWGDNTMEGLLDESGQYGACTANSSSIITLIFDQIYLFTFMEYKACHLGEGNQKFMLQDASVEYKVKESDDWVVLTTIDSSNLKYNPEINVLKFDSPVKARYWRFSKTFHNLFFGMLRMYGYAPYVAYKTKTGVVQPYDSQSATELVVTPEPIVEPTLIVQQTPEPIVETNPIVGQPVVVQQPVVVVTPEPIVETTPVVVSQPVVQQTPVVVTPEPIVQSIPVVSQPMVQQPVTVVSDEPKLTSGDVNCIPPLELKQSSKDSWGENTLQGLLDDSGNFGVCTSSSTNQWIEIKYDSVYLFTFMDFKCSKLGESRQLSSLENVKIEYKINESDNWIHLTSLNKSELKINPQLNTLNFNSPVKARYWRFFKEENDNLFFGMIRLYGYCEYIPIQTKSGVVLSLKEQLAMWEPKYTGPEINLIPIKSLESKGDSRRENTLEGLLDNTGDYGYVTANNQDIILSYDHVYLFTHIEYMTLATSNHPIYGIKDTRIEYKLMDSDSWSLLATIEEKDINLCPLVNTIKFPQPLKAKFFRLVANGSNLEIGMFRVYGHSPFVPIQTKSGPIISPELLEMQSKDKYPGCADINLIKPHSLYANTHKREKLADHVIDDLLNESGMQGFTTGDSSSSFIEIFFDNVYKFRVMTFKEHSSAISLAKEDGWGRKQTSSLIGTLVEYKLKNSDEWIHHGQISNVSTNVKGVFMLDFGELGIEAKCFRLVQVPPSGLTGKLAVGMLRFYAYAPVQTFKIGTFEYSGEEKMEILRNDHSGIEKLSVNLIDPIYTENTCQDVNVVAPIKIHSSRGSKQASNSVEGLLDDSGKSSYHVHQQVHNYIILEFETVFLFKYLEWMKNDTTNFLDNVQSELYMYYKVQESDSWTKFQTFNGKYYHHPRINVLKFGEGVKARFWKFERVCGDFSFGMLQFFALAPFVPYNCATNGLLLSREQQEATHMTPYRGNEINCLIPDEMSLDRDNDETKTPKAQSKKNTNDRAENTMAGLLDDSAEYGICSSYGTLILSYTNIHFFKYIEYYTHCLYDEKTQTLLFSNVDVSYKIRPNEPWIPLEKTISSTKAYPYLNRFEIDESSLGLKARFWKFETSNVMLLGTLRVYGYGEFKSVPTRTGTILPIDGDVKKYKLQEKLKKIQAHNKLIQEQEKTKYCKVCLEDLEENIDTVMDCKTCGIGLCDRDAKVHRKKNPTHEITERVATTEPLAEESEAEEDSSHDGGGMIGEKRPTNIKDLKGLENFYDKLIPERFTNSTTGMGPLKQLKNDNSLLVNYASEGTSSIQINLPPNASSTKLSERDKFYTLCVKSRKLFIEFASVRFTNTLSTPISITSLNIEYLDHDGTTWKSFNDCQAGYWRPITVAKATTTNFGRDVEYIIQKSDSRGEYVFSRSVNIKAGSTTDEYIVNATMSYGGTYPTSVKASSMIPYDLPYPCTLRFSITDSLGQSRSIKIVYMAPELKGIKSPKEIQKSHHLRDQLDFFEECSDNVNREQAFVGIRLDKKSEGIVLFNTGMKETKTFDLATLRFKFEKSNQDEIQLWEANSEYCKAKFYLLCDNELFYRGYCIKVVASSVSHSNSITRFYPIYEMIQKFTPISL